MNFALVMMFSQTGARHPLFDDAGFLGLETRIPEQIAICTFPYCLVLIPPVGSREEANLGGSLFGCTYKCRWKVRRNGLCSPHSPSPKH